MKSEISRASQQWMKAFYVCECTLARSLSLSLALSLSKCLCEATGVGIFEWISFDERAGTCVCVGFIDFDGINPNVLHFTIPIDLLICEYFA